MSREQAKLREENVHVDWSPYGLTVLEARIPHG